jgi:hypothetical protein
MSNNGAFTKSGQSPTKDEYLTRGYIDFQEAERHGYATRVRKINIAMLQEKGQSCLCK